MPADSAKPTCLWTSTGSVIAARTVGGVTAKVQSGLLMVSDPSFYGADSRLSQSLSRKMCFILSMMLLRNKNGCYR